MTNEKTKWRITAEDPPPEYSFLEGRNAVGDEFKFHCSCLEGGVRLYLGTDLNPIATPYLWRYANEE